jgi:hypothetical protein
MHAKAMLLIDHHKSEVAERDGFLEQRVGSDQDIDAPLGKSGQDLLPLAALLAAGEKRDAQTCGRGKGLYRLEMLAPEQLGRRHERGLRSGLDRGRHGEKGDDGLAAADIALQEPQHAVGIGEIGVNFRERAGLRSGELEGEFGKDGLAELAGSGEGAPGAAAQTLPDHGERKLIGQQLVIGEPRPCRR